mgnify:CR=1 FL=1
MRIAKLISALVGVTMVIGSLGIAAAGTFMVAATDDVDGFISLGPVRVQTDSAAVLGDDIDVFLDEPVRGGVVLGFDDIKARLAVDSRNDKDLFVGIGPSDEVNRYLAGTSYSVVEVFNDDVVLDSFAGSLATGRPADQDFWVTSTLEDTLTWNLESGNWSVVLMNEDGSTGIDSAVTVAGKVPFLRPIGAALIVVGLIGLGVGVLLTYFGIRSDREVGVTVNPQPPLEPIPAA